MARAARGMSGELRGQIDRAADGGRWSLALVAVLAVGREGLETALFLWAATEAGTREAAGAVTPTWQPLLGAALGILTAVALGYLLYRGAISINLSRFFTWTGAFLILVAAGVLVLRRPRPAGGRLPARPEHHRLRRLATSIDPGTWYATLLKGVFNFSPATTVLEAAVWVAVRRAGDGRSSSDRRTRRSAPRPAAARRPPAPTPAAR